MNLLRRLSSTVVTPAKAGVHPSPVFSANCRLGWMAAFAAMTVLADEVAR